MEKKLQNIKHNTQNTKHEAPNLQLLPFKNTQPTMMENTLNTSDEEIEALINRQETYYYFSVSSTKYSDTFIEWHAKIADWAHSLVDDLILDRELVAIALNFAGRFVATSRTKDSEKMLRAVAFTSLYMTVKLYSREYKEVKMSTFAKLCGYKNVNHDIAYNMENRIIWYGLVFESMTSSLILFIILHRPDLCNLCSCQGRSTGG